MIELYFVHSHSHLEKVKTYNSDNPITLGGTLCLEKDYLHLRDSMKIKVKNVKAKLSNVFTEDILSPTIFLNIQELIRCRE